jgi:hypothetical protein
VKASIRVLTFLLSFSSLLGCIRIGMPSNAPVPPTRPESLDQYYSKDRTYHGFKEHMVRPFKDYTIRRLVINSEAGEIVVDYYQLRRKTTKELVFVFPVLGGKPVIESYLSDYLTQNGYETAIVHRNNEFQDTAHFDSLEEIFRLNVVRDRITIDFFEQEFGKTRFGGIGMSRGAINLATTAGVDPRLERNVLILGATDLASIFKDSSERRIRKYVRKITQERDISKEKFQELFRKQVFTDPLSVARYLDPQNTLLVLAVFDESVPFQHGVRLRRQIGEPETIYLLAEHRSSVAFTQIVKVFPPSDELCIFPFDYVEGETLDFFNESFGRRRRWWHLFPLKLMQTPLNIMAELLHPFWGNRAQKIPSPPSVLSVRRLPGNARSIPSEEITRISGSKPL